ncbi:MAG: hypothetical protein BWX64_01807 [Acidobacteria bacterium ADurb.Bin051]|nr:MAG: hypothetical protein BWX64_01807 [Acidobacteria bacterium ADurb.Bin051]
MADAGAAAVADDLGGGREDDPRIEGERAVDPAGERTGTLPGVGLGARDLAGEADDLRVPGFDERPRREERPELGGDRARGGERSGGRRGSPDLEPAGGARGVQEPLGAGCERRPAEPGLGEREAHHQPGRLPRRREAEVRRLERGGERLGRRGARRRGAGRGRVGALEDERPERARLARAHQPPRGVEMEDADTRDPGSLLVHLPQGAAGSVGDRHEGTPDREHRRQLGFELEELDRVAGGTERGRGALARRLRAGQLGGKGELALRPGRRAVGGHEPPAETVSFHAGRDHLPLARQLLFAPGAQEAAVGALDELGDEPHLDLAAEAVEPEAQLAAGRDPAAGERDDLFGEAAGGRLAEAHRPPGALRGRCRGSEEKREEAGERQEPPRARRALARRRPASVRGEEAQTAITPRSAPAPCRRSARASRASAPA